MGLGQLAYRAYCMSTGGRSLVSGDPLPAWSEQAPEIRSAWVDAAEAVRAVTAGRDLVEERAARAVEKAVMGDKAPELTGLLNEPGVQVAAGSSWESGARAICSSCSATFDPAVQSARCPHADVRTFG